MLMNEKTMLTIVRQKIKKFISNVEGYIAIRVSSHDCKGQFWQQRG